jgi:hypothetical protein
MEYIRGVCPSASASFDNRESDDIRPFKYRKYRNVKSIIVTALELKKEFLEKSNTVNDGTSATPAGQELKTAQPIKEHNTIVIAKGPLT